MQLPVHLKHFQVYIDLFVDPAEHDQWVTDVLDADADGRESLLDELKAIAAQGQDPNPPRTTRGELVERVLALGGCDPEGREDYQPRGANPLGDPGDKVDGAPMGFRQRKLSNVQINNIVRWELGRRPDAKLPDDPKKSWFNYIGYHVPYGGGDVSACADGIERHQPGSVAKLITLLQKSTNVGRTVRAVGSGHSASGVATPSHDLVWLGEIADLSVPGDAPLPAGYTPSAMRAAFTLPGGDKAVRIAAGLPIWKANRALWDEGLALRNLGAYDEQSVFGAFGAGTHGSGGHLGPLAEDLLSVDMLTVDATGGVRPVRVERAGGPTDPAQFAAAHPRWSLIQRDDAFDAVAVSYGQMGIAFAVTLRVTAGFYLHEVRTEANWSALRGHLVNKVRTAAVNGVFLQIIFDPIGQKAVLLERTRTADSSVLQVRRANGLTRMARSNGPSFAYGLMAIQTPKALMSAALRIILNTPDITVAGAKPGKKAAKREMVGRSWDVLYMGGGAWQTAVASEFAVPLDRSVAVLDRLIALVASESRGQRRVLMPFGVRFVRASDLWMSSAYRCGWRTATGRRDLAPDDIVMYLEMPVPLIANVKPREAAWGMVDTLRSAVTAEFGARPHAGKYHRLDDAGIREQWGDAAVDAWLAVRAELDPGRRFTGPRPFLVG